MKEKTIFIVVRWGETFFKKGVPGLEKAPENVGQGRTITGSTARNRNTSAWSGGSTYDYGFRLYNPEIGKFLIVDSISANFQNLSPYQFVGLDSIKFIDLDGLERAIHRSGRGHVIPASDFHQHTPECQSNLACIGTFITQKHSGKQESACSGITTHEEYDTLPAGRQEIEATTI